MSLTLFKDLDFLPAIKALFKELRVPLNYVADEPTTAQDILKDTYKDNATFQLVQDVYFVGMVDDAAFEGNKSLEVSKIKSDYDGILVFGLTLRSRESNLLPTRSQLAEIARAFNREFYYTPVVLVYKYQDVKSHYLAFANTERLPYKQEWREGEKAGKVSLLRDIDIQKPHRGHEDIIDLLRIPTSGSKAVDSFAKLYTYWQEVFSVSILNKKFYQELSNWYFWAIKYVTFPSKPTPEQAHTQKVNLDDLIQEHKATNVIRLLTRLLFTWFIKEKKLIPEELFDVDALQKDILKEISPYHENEGSIFKQANKDSVYYRAILQNLFFASLNCPIEADGIDNRTRGFRGEGYGTHRGIDYLMRYKAYFKDPEAFLKLMNETVPFLNGGLFECLDDKYQNVYIDGFSDQMTKGEQLIVPDYLFFGIEEKVDLSAEMGISNSGTKQAAVKGLINILKSYKFTITENTPIEEDVALDPELLGKVFENLLASYNPETKTTARKQTGSFYTPREIVNYMVDEGLIAYLKNALKDHPLDEKDLDEKLHQLTSYDPINPFVEETELTRMIVDALDQCKILDPASGSGAFPMGILQKMVHILQKLDPDNGIWKQVQLRKAMAETEEAFTIIDKNERQEKLIEINNAFDERVNDPDYARKLYLIENCIYGVDIQPIATQIAKLRFFISLVVDQRKNLTTPNFGIRPLPNLETRFVTANTLIGIEKPKAQTNLFDTGEIKKLEAELKKVRHKLFSARTKETKLKYRQRDEELRSAIGEELKRSGWPNDTAERLADWDPYDQNATSPFFDPEWMFDIANGFDVVIGNPPYVQLSKMKADAKVLSKAGFATFEKAGDLYCLFYEQGIKLLKTGGVLSYITSNSWLQTKYGESLRRYFVEKSDPLTLLNFVDTQLFETAIVETNILLTQKGTYRNRLRVAVVDAAYKGTSLASFVDETGYLQTDLPAQGWSIGNAWESSLKIHMEAVGKKLGEWPNSIYSGIKTGLNQAYLINEATKNQLLEADPKNAEVIKLTLRGRDLSKYSYIFENQWIIFTHNGLKNSSLNKINVEVRYPKVFDHLKSYLPQIQTRYDQGDHWSNLRNCAYLKEFEKPKIVWSKLSDKAQFTYDEIKTYPINTIIFMTGEKLMFLLATLNSKISEWYFNEIATTTGMGTSEWINNKVEQLPIPEPTPEQEQHLETLVTEILNRKKAGQATQSLENEVDARVMALYGLAETDVQHVLDSAGDLRAEDRAEILAVWGRVQQK